MRPNVHSLYRDSMTTSEVTCREECPYYTSSKTKVQNANEPKVRLHKMDANLLVGNDLRRY